MMQDLIHDQVEALYASYRNAEIRFVEHGVAAFKMSDIRKNLGKVQYEKTFNKPFDENDSIVEIDGEYYMLTLSVKTEPRQAGPHSATGFGLN